MIELCHEYLSVWCIWLYVLIMSHIQFRVNPHSIVAWMSRNSLLQTGTLSEVKVTAITLTSDILPVLSKEFLDIQATMECGFTLKHVSDMIKTYCQIHRKDKYSEDSSINWPLWLHGLVFIYKRSSCSCESCCSHLKFRYPTCFKQGVFLTAIWLPHGQLWAIIKGTASLNWC